MSEFACPLSIKVEIVAKECNEFCVLLSAVHQASCYYYYDISWLGLKTRLKFT